MSRINAIISGLNIRLNTSDANLLRNATGSREPLIYGWIEYPAWAARIPDLQDLIEKASKQAKEYEHYGNTIRISDMVPNGRFDNLESILQACLIPFDCGGEDPIDHTPWAGWWRAGYRYPVTYQVSVAGGQLVALDVLRDVLHKYDENTPLSAALREFLNENDKSPPVALREIAATKSIASRSNDASMLKALKGAYRASYAMLTTLWVRWADKGVSIVLSLRTLVLTKQRTTSRELFGR